MYYSSLCSLFYLSEPLTICFTKETMHVHSNLLEGTMPDSFCKLFDKNLASLWADCGGKLPLFNCSCCTNCFP